MMAAPTAASCRASVCRGPRLLRGTQWRFTRKQLDRTEGHQGKGGVFGAEQEAVLVLRCLWGLCFSSNAPFLWSGHACVCWGGVAGASSGRDVTSGLCDLMGSLRRADPPGKPSPPPLQNTCCHPQAPGPPPLASADGPPRDASRESSSSLLHHVLGLAELRENPHSLLCRGTGDRRCFLCFSGLGCWRRNGSFPPSRVALGKQHTCTVHIAEEPWD